MDRLTLSRGALSVCTAAALLVGCGGLPPPIGAPGATQQNVDPPDRGAAPKSYQVLYSFGAAPDGNYPIGGLIDVSGILYGTTYNGGVYGCAQFTCGTVFSLTTSGSEKVLHSFTGEPNDGASPSAGLTDVSGTLYGTTTRGGGDDLGTAFSITTGGTEKVLHSFCFPPDGCDPDAPLINANGKLYGVTDEGGWHACLTSVACGTVFRITTGGKEKVLHAFGKGKDGRFPGGGLVNVNGTFYGVTYEGGKYNSGTVFSITTSRTEKVLHSFGKGTDGRNPQAQLIDVNGTLYGTTSAGGKYKCGSRPPCGTVFSITTTGAEKVLHSFGKGTDGSNPAAGLVDLRGTLYGTTYNGGRYTCVTDVGAYTCGTVFSITTAGAEKVLHNFGKGTDGRNPLAGLYKKGQSLLGTTEGGGVRGYGTVFSLTP